MYIDDELATELKDKITSLMHCWHPCDNASDFRCELCGATAPTNHEDIIHHNDCLGIKLMHALREGSK